MKSSNEDVVVSLPLHAADGTEIKIHDRYEDGVVVKHYRRIDGAWVVIEIDTSRIQK